MTAAAAEKTTPTEFGVKDHANSVLATVDVDAIDVPDPKTLDAAEVAKLADNIKRVGLIHQPVVMKNGRRYTVITGRRRVAAVQLLAIDERTARINAGADYKHDDRFTTVDVYVRTERKTSPEEVAALVLSENAMRSANVLGELRSVNVLIEAGHDAKEIAARTGQHVSWIRHRMILNKLTRPAMTLFETGRMRFETAQRLARLDAEQQKRCVEVFRAKPKSETGGVFSMSDIMTGTSRPTRALPAAMFAPLPPVGSTTTDGVLAERGITDPTPRDVVDATFTAEERAITAPKTDALADVREFVKRGAAAQTAVDAETEAVAVGVQLSMLDPIAQLSIIAARLEVLVALMPDVASRDALKRARSRVIVGREAIGGGAL